MYHIVCYGDSNTWGDCPLGGRWPYEVRWTGILQTLLGTDFLVHEEGINGRTTVFDDPMGGTYRNGLKGLGYVLSTHGPIDVLVIMLGTNDTKENLNASPYAIAKGMETLVSLTEHFVYPQDQGVRHVLIVSPIAIGDRIMDVPRFRTYGPTAPEKSRRLAPLYQEVARTHHCAFFDASTVAGPSEEDQLHMMPKDHKALAEALAPLVRDLALKS
ncbi:MAG: SGNH/GDSL hydrolase family protein [Sphaerochaetaceae bacterium]|nr:SGNH/GDSL hydrolase family protein [Spirochaetales bacterium]MDY5499733.1 SGNH/GDSL hydrolase family protein [Sphaerochaetaceae bacterium]